MSKGLSRNSAAPIVWSSSPVCPPESPLTMTTGIPAVAAVEASWRRTSLPVASGRRLSSRMSPVVVDGGLHAVAVVGGHPQLGLRSAFEYSFHQADVVRGVLDVQHGMCHETGFRRSWDGCLGRAALRAGVMMAWSGSPDGPSGPGRPEPVGRPVPLDAESSAREPTASPQLLPIVADRLLHATAGGYHQGLLTSGSRAPVLSRRIVRPNTDYELPDASNTSSTVEPKNWAIPASRGQGYKSPSAPPRSRPAGVVGVVAGQRGRVVEERALVKIGALAARGALQPAADKLDALDLGRDLRQLPVGQVAEPGGRRAVVRRCGQQFLDLIEGQARPLRGVDHRERAHDTRVIPARPADPHRRGQQPDLLVVADRGRALAGQPGHRADAEQRDAVRSGIGI